MGHQRSTGKGRGQFISKAYMLLDATELGDILLHMSMCY